MQIVFLILGYISGSLPFALWVTRLVKGIDVRDGGSGHIGATNTMRQAGWGPGVLVLVLDIGKGFLPTYLALHYQASDWIVALTAALVVVGHCWTVFAQFRGGMGLAAMGGTLLAIAPLYFWIGLGLLIALVLLIKHSARAGVFTGILLAPVFLLLGQRGVLILVAAATGLVTAIRFTIDWNRQYRELWLDRERE
ncbi:MAG: glycerol-3-phosphate acyltransferase [Chloroflexi bacterium]|nr:glycerol-3-phosphate acyltransferase [Chloroflexota bacterium]